MTPWQRAKQWWDDHSTQDFWEAVGEHLSSGYVWNSPTTFMLAKGCRWNAEDKQFEHGEHNCWFVTLASGVGNANAPWELMRLFPHPHRHVAWLRRQQFEPRIYDWDKLLKKVKGQ